MKYITEKELKDWFEMMKNKYKGGQANEHLKFVENQMFDAFWKDFGNNLVFEEVKENV